MNSCNSRLLGRCQPDTCIISDVRVIYLSKRGCLIYLAIETNRVHDKTTINSIRSIHYRNSHLHIIGWIVEGLCDYFRNDFMESWFKIIENELQSKPQYNSVDVRKQLISAAKIVESFISSK